MKLLDNSLIQSDHNVLVDNDQCKISQSKLSDDLSLSTIQIYGLQEYTFTARSGILSVSIGLCKIVCGSQEFELNLFNRVALTRGEKVTIKNTQTYPLTLNYISAN